MDGGKDARAWSTKKSRVARRRDSTPTRAILPGRRGSTGHPAGGGGATGRRSRRGPGASPLPVDSSVDGRVLAAAEMAEAGQRREERDQRGQRQESLHLHVRHLLLEVEVLERLGRAAVEPGRPAVVARRPARSPWAIQAAARWLDEDSWSKLASAAANCSSASSSRSCSSSARPSTSWALPISSRWSSRSVEHLERLARLLLGELDLAGAEVHLGERRDDPGGVDVVADVDQDLEGLLEVGDRVLGLPSWKFRAPISLRSLPTFAWSRNSS